MPTPAPDPAAKPYRYFISHASEDLPLARQIRAGLQTFNKRWNSFRSTTVYLDETNLAANPDIRQSIETALRSSEYLILLASPFAAAPDWVRREIEIFLASHPPDRLIIVLGSGSIFWLKSGGVDWNVTTALPKDLAVDAFSREPKYVDLSWASDPDRLDPANPRFRTEIARLVAGSSSQSVDDLISEDARKFRTFRRRHILGTAIRAALTFGCAPLLFPLFPDFWLQISGIPETLALKSPWLGLYAFVQSYERYFPFGEPLLVLGAASAVIAGAGFRAAPGFALGFFLLAPFHAFAALRTYENDPFERLIVCLFYALSFAVVGALGGAFSKRTAWRTLAAACAIGGLVAAVIRFFQPASRDSFPGTTMLPVPILRGPWLGSRLHIAIAALSSVGNLRELSWSFPLIVAGAVSGLLLGWRFGVADMPEFAPRSFWRVHVPRRWVAAAAVLACTGGLAAATFFNSERRQLEITRSELLTLTTTRLLKASCSATYQPQQIQSLLFETRDLLRQIGPPALYNQLEREAGQCMKQWADSELPELRDNHFEDKLRWLRNLVPLPELPWRTGGLSRAEVHQLLTTVQNSIPPADRIATLPALAKAWQVLGDTSAERPIVQEMQATAARLPSDSVVLRARYAEAFWRANQREDARAVLASVIRRLGTLAPDPRKLYNAGLTLVDGMALWKTGLWQSLPPWRANLNVQAGVLAAMAADRAPPASVREICEAQGRFFADDLFRFALDTAEDGMIPEAVGALDAADICGFGSDDIDVLQVALDDALAHKDDSAVKRYVARIHRVLEKTPRNDGKIENRVGTPAACALAQAGETAAAIDIAVKVYGGVPEPAPDAILCVAAAERLAGRKDRALAALHLAWTAVSHDMQPNPGPELQKKGIALELARLGEFRSARIVAHECTEPLDRLEVLAAILRQKVPTKKTSHLH